MAVPLEPAGVHVAVGVEVVPAAVDLAPALVKRRAVHDVLPVVGDTVPGAVLAAGRGGGAEAGRAAAELRGEVAFYRRLIAREEFPLVVDLIVRGVRRISTGTSPLGGRDVVVGRVVLLRQGTHGHHERVVRCGIHIRADVLAGVRGLVAGGLLLSVVQRIADLQLVLVCKLRECIPLRDAVHDAAVCDGERLIALIARRQRAHCDTDLTVISIGHRRRDAIVTVLRRMMRRGFVAALIHIGRHDLVFSGVWHLGPLCLCAVDRHGRCDQLVKRVHQQAARCLGTVHRHGIHIGTADAGADDFKVVIEVLAVALDRELHGRRNLRIAATHRRRRLRGEGHGQPVCVVIRYLVLREKRRTRAVARNRIGVCIDLDRLDHRVGRCRHQSCERAGNHQCFLYLLHSASFPP